MREGFDAEQLDMVAELTPPRKLIEVGLPIDAINDASHYDKMPSVVGPKRMHWWWARLPLPAPRAMLFASVVTDPADDPQYRGADDDAIRKARERLFGLVRELMKPKAHENAAAFVAARKEMEKHCGGKLPKVADPFAGGGSIPLEAQRLGFEAEGRDINPVAILLQRAWIDFPARFQGRAPVGKGKDANRKIAGGSASTIGLASDIEFYGGKALDVARRTIAEHFPPVELPDTKQKRAAVAYLWTRVIPCPNPACGGMTPLLRTTSLSKSCWIEPNKNGKSVTFIVKDREPNFEIPQQGAKCIHCNLAFGFDVIRDAGKKGLLAYRLMAIVVDGPEGRRYVSGSAMQETTALQVQPRDRLGTSLPRQGLGFRVQAYGIVTHDDLFTPRQLESLLALSDQVRKTHSDIVADAVAQGWALGEALEEGGVGAKAYADAIVTYLSFAIDRLADFNCVLSRWKSSGEQQMQLFGRAAVPMVWDFAEANVVGTEGVAFERQIKYVAEAVRILYPTSVKRGQALHEASQVGTTTGQYLFATDPPYYDNIGYADLSDFFYVWLRRTLHDIHPRLLSTVLTPKTQELIADPDRHDGSRDRAAKHYEAGLVATFSAMRANAVPDFPMTAYYAFKQDDEGETGSDLTTGWETFLTGMIEGGWTITATWPVRASQGWRLRARDSNALASYIVLAARPRPRNAAVGTRQEFVRALREKMPAALRALKQSSLAATDLAQAAIGPGMAIFSGYSRVIDAAGQPMSIRSALDLINQELVSEADSLTGEFDAESRWAFEWFREHGFDNGEFDEAQKLSRAKNTTLDILSRMGLAVKGAGKVRLLARKEIRARDPLAADDNEKITVWGFTHQLLKLLLDTGSEEQAGKLLARAPGLGEQAKNLAYSLHIVSDRKGWAAIAQDYNALVIAWPELVKLSRPGATGLDAFA